VYKIRNTRNASLADICPAPAGLSLFPAAQILLVCIAAKVLTHTIYMPACTYLWRKKRLKSDPPRLVFCKIFEDKLCHRTAANVAVTDEHDFYHSTIINHQLLAAFLQVQVVHQCKYRK
jgi:hypothetical protein